MLAIAMGKRDDDRARARALARLRKRLEARMRLEELAGALHTVTQEQRELERLKYFYLPMWSEWCLQSTIARGLPSEVPFTEYMKPSVREFDETGGQKIDPDACRLVDQAVNELVIDQGILHARVVLAVRYLNQRVGAAVFRSKRLCVIDPDQVDELCDHVERQLLPIVKRKGLLL